MATKLCGVLVDLSQVSENKRPDVLCAVRDKIYRNGAFRGTLDQLSSVLVGFDFARHATDPERQGAVVEINAFLCLQDLPAEARAF
ncbi:MAG: hypothetical protein ABIR46_00145 [Candidatus Saccharimonadales bacterium]